MVLAGLALTGSACTIVDGNGVIVEEKRALSTFSEIELDSDMRLDIEVNPEAQTPFELKVLGDENLMPYIRTRFEGRRLVIEETEWLNPTRTVTGRVVVPSLRGIEVSDSASVLITGIDQRTLRIAADSNSRVALQGQVEELSILAQGSSRVDALDLVSWRARAELSGSADAAVCVEETLEARASGSASLSFACHPFHIFEDITESASVRPY